MFGEMFIFKIFKNKTPTTKVGPRLTLSQLLQEKYIKSMLIIDFLLLKLKVLNPTSQGINNFITKIAHPNNGKHLLSHISLSMVLF